MSPSFVVMKADFRVSNREVASARADRSRAAHGKHQFARLSLILLALVVASGLAVLPAAARTASAATTHQKLFVTVKQNMPAAAENKLVVAVMVNQNGGPWASSEATPSEPAAFIQNNSRRYLVKVFLESSCKGVCETTGYRISGAARHKLMVIPSCRYASEVFICSKIRVVKIY
jgi:hypothetical protein